MELVLLFVAGTATGLAICWLRINMAFPAQDAEDYNSSGQEFDVRTHLSGSLVCEGVIFGPFGRVSSRFVASFHGKWDGDTGELLEDFVYDGGETQSRVWTLSVGPDGRVEANAPDVVGTGIGHQAGSALGMKYRLRLPPEAGGYVLDATDWIYLLDNGTLINRSQFRKLGITVAELVATIRPEPVDAASGEDEQEINRETKVRTAA